VEQRVKRGYGVNSTIVDTFGKRVCSKLQFWYFSIDEVAKILKENGIVEWDTKYSGSSICIYYDHEK